LKVLKVSYNASFRISKDTKLFINGGNEMKDLIKNKSVEIFILGTNKYGLSLSNWLLRYGYNIKGFINDYIDIAYFNDFKVFKSERNYQNSHIVNCIVEGRIIDAENNIKKLSPKSHNHYFDFWKKYPEELLNVDFLKNSDSLSASDIKKIKNLMSDEQSKREFELVAAFRVNRNIEYMQGFKFRINEQYFEYFLNLPDNPSFVDGGGYEGETVLKFIKKYPIYDHIFYFEPCEDSMLKSKINLRNVKNITYYQVGLWHEKNYLHFNSNLGNANFIDENGNTEIKVDSLDNIIGPLNQKIDFIKLDVEGAEYNALIGAEETIIKHKPKLAICVYHNSLDFIRIPELVLSYCSDYEIYFRHYTQGVVESVMFFV
jgi:FkbM family methyltransferase